MTADKPIRIAGSTIRPRWAWSKWYAAETRLHLNRMANPDFALIQHFTGTIWLDANATPRASGVAAKRDAARVVAYRRGDAP